MKPCYGKCNRCVWRYNGGCSEWRRLCLICKKKSCWLLRLAKPDKRGHYVSVAIYSDVAQFGSSAAPGGMMLVRIQSSELDHLLGFSCFSFKLRDHKNSHTKLADPQLMKENEVKRP